MDEENARLEELKRGLHPTMDGSVFVYNNILNWLSTNGFKKELEN